MAGQNADLKMAVDFANSNVYSSSGNSLSVSCDFQNQKNFISLGRHFWVSGPVKKSANRRKKAQVSSRFCGLIGKTVEPV